MPEQDKAPVSDAGQVVTTPDGQVGTPPPDDGQAVIAEPVYSYTDKEGKKYTTDDVENWRTSGLRQDDYTRKTQELAEQRKELESFKEAVADMQELMQHRDPDLWAYATGQSTQRPSLQKEFDDPVDGLQHRLNTLEQNFTLSATKMQLENALKSLPADADKNEVLKFMRDKKIGDPQIAYRSMTYDRVYEKARKETEAELSAKLTKAKTEALKPPVTTNAIKLGNAPPPTAPIKDKVQYTVDKMFSGG